MRVLAFDCSTAAGSVAVVESGTTTFAETCDFPRGRGGAFFPVLERAVRFAGRVDRIVVGIGPGSYNGLRTAIAAAEGLSLATGAALCGVASVRALPCEGGEYVAVSDARGGVFYHVRVRGREIAGDFELLDAAALSARLGAETAPILTSSPIPAAPQACVATPDAAILASLASAHAARALEPIYLKPAHITQPKRTELRPRHK